MLLNNDIEISERTTLERTGMSGSIWKAGVESEILPAVPLPFIPSPQKISVVLVSRRYCSCLNSVFALRHRPLHPSIRQGSASRDLNTIFSGPR